jgi:putative lipoic acid-binding regulatory protein
VIKNEIKNFKKMNEIKIIEYLKKNKGSYKSATEIMRETNVHQAETILQRLVTLLIVKQKAISGGRMTYAID